MMKEYRFDQIAIVSTEKKKPTEEDRVNYVGLEHLSPDTFDVTEYGSEVAPKGDKLVMRKGDVLFGKRRAYQKKVGIAPCDGIFSAHGMVLRPNEDVVDSRFFPFFIKSDCFLDEAIRISVGSLSPTVNWRDLRELRFRLPSLERQHELAELLWAGEELKSTYSQLLFACDEQVKSRFVEMFSVSVPGQSRRLEDCCSEIYGGSTPSMRRDDFYGGSIPFIKSGDIKTDVVSEGALWLTDNALRETSSRLTPSDSVLLVVRSAILRKELPVATNAVPVVINQDIKAFIPLPEFRSRYLLNAIRSNSAEILKRVQSVNTSNLNMKDILDLQVMDAPIERQDEFVSFAAHVDKSEYL